MRTTGTPSDTGRAQTARGRDAGGVTPGCASRHRILPAYLASKVRVREQRGSGVRALHDDRPCPRIESVAPGGHFQDPFRTLSRRRVRIFSATRVASVRPRSTRASTVNTVRPRTNDGPPQYPRASDSL